MKKNIYLCIVIVISSMVQQLLYAQTQSQNYIVTETMLNSGGTASIMSVQYYDGLGRPTQLKTNGVSPLNYVCTHKTYDRCGRDSVSWLAFNGGSSPSFIAPDDIGTYAYNTYRDPHAYSVTEYDALNRPKSISTPGNAWHSANKMKTTEYTTNNVGDHVHCYKATSLNGYALQNSGNYSSNTLFVEISRDEDNHEMAVFKDIQGHVVLERRAGNNDTYYVYYGDLLRFVLPPMASNNPSSEYINNYAYIYNYDSRGRCVEKKLPECTSITYIYDVNDRLAFMQDGNMSQEGKYRFYLYDGLGRLAIQGICDNADSRVNNLPACVKYTSTGYEVCNTGYRLQASYSLNNPKIEIVNYYDNYNFLNGSLVQSLTGNYDLSSTNYDDATSFLTGQIISTSNGKYLCSALYYDYKGNIKNKRETILGGGMLATTTNYSHTNKPETITETLTKNGSTRTVVQNNEYNDADLLWKQTHQYGSRTVVTTANYLYNTIGLLSTFKQRNENIITNYAYNVQGWVTGINSHMSGSNIPRFEETIHYTDGPGTPYYNGNISSTKFVTNTNSTNSNVYYSYRYSYDQLNRMTNAIYGYGPTNAPAYSDNNLFNEQVTYDANSNITSLVRRGLQSNGTNGIIDNLTYGYNGGNRLLSVNDNAQSVLTAGALNFKDNTISTHGAPEYGYDRCGAMTYDSNKGITKINYDYLGNPTRIQFADRNVTEYVYSADGRRLKTIHRTAVPQSTMLAIGEIHNLTASEIQSVDSTEYVGSYIYDNGSLARCNFDGGYVISPFVSTNYRFYIKDHLGNNRMVTDATGNVLQSNEYYPYGGLTGRSTNPEYQKFKYNGKEYDTMHGLNEYDYGARQYDPAIARFTSMDPLCEKYYHISPYAYCGGNPVNAIDSDGRKVVFINGLVAFGAKSGRAYWTNHFIRNTNSFFEEKQGSEYVTNIKHGWLSSAKHRYNKGYKWAKEHINELTENMYKGETFKLVSHSMGAAFSKGVEKYLKEQGYQVKYNVMISGYQVGGIPNAPDSDTKDIDVKIKKDPVLKLTFCYNSLLENVEVKGEVNKGVNNILGIHASFSRNKNFWNEVLQLINEQLNSNK